MTLQIVWIFYKHIDVTKSSRIAVRKYFSQAYLFFFHFQSPQVHHQLQSQLTVRAST